MPSVTGHYRRAFAASLFSLTACLASAAQAADWTTVRSAVAIRSIATDGTVYVGAATNGIWTSTDLKTWTRVSLRSDAGLLFNDVVWDGQRFRAVGWGIVSSTDGINWDVEGSSNGLEVSNAIALMGRTHIAVGAAGDGTGTGGLLRGVHTTSWGGVILPRSALSVVGITGGLVNMTGATTDGNQFVVKGVLTAGFVSRDFLMTSPDGLNWTSRALASNTGYMSGGLNAAAWGNGTFVAGSEAGVYTSPDGVNWTGHELGNASQPNGSFWLFNHIRFLNGGFVAAGFDASESTARDDTAVFTSADGVSWTSHSLAARGSSTFDMSDITFSQGKYVAAGYQGVYTSSDGSTWAQTFTGPETNLTACVIAGDGIFDVPGVDGALVSSDGTSWNSKLVGTGAPTVTGEGCGAFANGVFVTTNGGIPQWSTDGKTWNVATVLAGADADDGVAAVATDGKQFLGLEAAAGLNAEVLTSTDGKTWKAQAVTGLPLHTLRFGATLGSDQTGGGFTYAGGRYIAWGMDLYRHPDPVIFTSVDGLKWTQATLSGPRALSSTRIGGVAFGNGNYLAVAKTNNGTYAFSSTDGAAWVGHRIECSECELYSLIWGDGEFMAAGEDTFRGHGLMMRIDPSTGAGTETLLDVPPLWDVAWDGKSYVAVSGHDIVQLQGGSSSGGGNGGSGGTGSSGGGVFGLGLLGLLAALTATRRRFG